MQYINLYFISEVLLLYRKSPLLLTLSEGEFSRLKDEICNEGLINVDHALD